MLRERDRHEKMLARLEQKQDPEWHYFRFAYLEMTTLDENESDRVVRTKRCGIALRN